MVPSQPQFLFSLEFTAHASLNEMFRAYISYIQKSTLNALVWVVNHDNPIEWKQNCLCAVLLWQIFVHQQTVDVQYLCSCCSELHATTYNQAPRITETYPSITWCHSCEVLYQTLPTFIASDEIYSVPGFSLRCTSSFCSFYVCEDLCLSLIPTGIISDPSQSGILQWLGTILSYVFTGFWVLPVFWISKPINSIWFQVNCQVMEKCYAEIVWYQNYFNIAWM